MVCLRDGCRELVKAGFFESIYSAEAFLAFTTEDFRRNCN